MNFLNLVYSFYLNFSLCSYFFTSLVVENILKMCLLLDDNMLLLLNSLEIIAYFNLSHSSISLVLTALKFLICISLLIFASGGMPSFSFDYLTKLGWISFLSLVLLFFLIEIFLLSLI